MSSKPLRRAGSGIRCTSIPHVTALVVELCPSFIHVISCICGVHISL